MIVTALGIYLMPGSFYSYWCRNKGLDQVIEKVPAPPAAVIALFILFWAPILPLDVYYRFLGKKK
ncbi:hypothetical protein CN491_04750 [Bacillus cereus]|uniref:Uncharacterized protein n=1 Tax=Bacillus cereus TaxID=1396 RepID=A0A2C1F624_BACCE|nr:MULTISPECIES: hypothetical protein [Bacillus cereus group]MDR4984530.1 hypothetical protein [Bacillus cereus]MEA1010958.1 hypothetical protein [Bacillus cereus]PES98118.1 hypothetical protein CN491_04750 [Bacillus cereus]PFP82886.1 hypothetical protein COJ95_02925 [Bacillus cereus]PGT20407.1 hypothetical protein COC96_00010 [Bacillus cereus]